MIQVRPMRHDIAALARYVQLFEDTFPLTASFTLPYLNWLYNANPDGLAIGFDAWAGDVLAAHYVCIPTQVRIEGVTSRSMLSLNTATHPDHQGKGLFTRLANATYEAATDQGISAVYGIANANSTPGFVRKLGFQLVKPLEAQVGWGALAVDWDRVNAHMTFQRDWNESNLSWRMNNPKNLICTRQSSDCRQFFAQAKGWFLPAYAELGLAQVPPKENKSRIHRWAPRLYLGLLPEGARGHSGYMNIPQAMRPSPLNFVYRSLSNLPKNLDGAGLHISFMDFDAY